MFVMTFNTESHFSADKADSNMITLTLVVGTFQLCSVLIEYFHNKNSL